MKKTALFLHMGPGMSAHVEREWLGAVLPSVHFWDQPRPHKERAYLELCKATLAEFQRLIHENGGQPVSLIAHSFGSTLAMDLLANCLSSQIKDLIFLAPIQNHVKGFQLLAGRILESHRDLLSAETQDIIQDLIASPISNNFENLLKICTSIIEDTRYPELYWGDLNLFKKFIEIAAGGPPIDLECFQAVFKDFYSSQIPGTFKRDALFLYGDSDPLCRFEEEKANWQSLFPKASFRKFSRIGHHVHLESEQVIKLLKDILLK